MKAAFYEVEITPPLGGFITGYYSRRFAKDVYERLYAKAVVIENNGEIIALLSFDACKLPEEAHDIITKRVYEYTGISPDRICVNINHTHCGIPISDNPEINAFGDDAYKDVFYRLAADAVILASKRLEDVEIKFGIDEVHGIAFNRNYVKEDGTLVTNHVPGSEPLAGVDPSLSVISFERDGKKIGAIINYACHQDCTGGLHGYTGDYSSVLSEELKEAYGKDFVSLFAIGACGDINHLEPGKEMPLNWHREMGKIIAEKAVCVIDSSKAIDGNVSVIKEKVTLPRRKQDIKTMSEQMINLYTNKKPGYLFMARNLGYYMAVNDKEYTEVYVQAFKIGNLCIYAMPGEIYVNIGLNIKKNSPFEHNVVIECCNSYLGYIPTENCFNEKSELYETSLSFHACHVPWADKILTEKALEISDKLSKER